MEKMMSNVYFQKQIHKLQAFVKSVFSTVNEGLSNNWGILKKKNKKKNMGGTLKIIIKKIKILYLDLKMTSYVYFH